MSHVSWLMSCPLAGKHSEIVPLMFAPSLPSHRLALLSTQTIFSAPCHLPPFLPRKCVSCRLTFILFLQPPRQWGDLFISTIVSIILHHTQLTSSSLIPSCLTPSCPSWGDQWGEWAPRQPLSPSWESCHQQPGSWALEESPTMTECRHQDSPGASSHPPVLQRSGDARWCLTELLWRSPRRLQRRWSRTPRLSVAFPPLQRTICQLFQSPGIDPSRQV